MDKEHVIGEIRRTAKANRGVALGWRRFEEETGIRYYDWFGQFWTRWSDAVREAGFEPNRMSEAYDDGFLLEKLVQLTRRLGHVPTQGDMRLITKSDFTFPSEKVFRRLGLKSQRASRVIAFCESSPGNDDVAALWKHATCSEQPLDADSATSSVGYVYLLRHGSRRHYKIGRTNNRLRREGEIGIELPEEIKPIHVIETDDPAGVEAYWHRRFAEKRLKNEWFELTPADVRAFKRWRRIC